jgi:hypothetical protein
VFLDRVGDPVNLGVTPNGLVERVNEDDLEVLVGRVLMPMLLNFLTCVTGVRAKQARLLIPGFVLDNQY